MLKLQVKPRSEGKVVPLSDAAWLEGLLRRAGAPVRPDEAPVPVVGQAGLSAIEGGERTAEAEGMAPELLIPSGLRARAERIVALSRNEGLPVFPVAVAPLFAGWRLHTKGKHYDYVFCNLAEDPLFSDPDGFPIPAHTLQHLHRLNRSSLARCFDLLYVVHEVEKGSIKEGEPLEAERLVPPSPHVRRASERLGSLGTVLWLGTALPLLGGAGLGLATAAGLAMIPLSLGLGLDPLLLGAVVAPQRPIRVGELAVWFYLTHWRYTAEEGERGG